MDRERLDIRGKRKDEACAELIKKREEMRKRIEQLEEQRASRQLTDYLESWNV